MPFSERTKRILTAGALLAVLCAGLAVRLDDLRGWPENPELYLHGSEPLIVTFDGYYYLALAQDLLDGTYHEIDEKRAVPDHPRRPFPPPLLSLLTAGLAWLTPFSLNRVAVFLPPLLGLSLAIPLFAFGRRWGGRSMALTAALLGLLSQYYVYRTSLAVYDTDCLIVSFTLSIAYCFLRFGRTAGRVRQAYLAGGCLLYVLFLVWWDSTPAAVTVLSLSSLLLALALYYRPERAQAWRLLAGVGAGLVLLPALLGWQRVLGLPESVIRTLRYLVKTRADDFPAIGLTVDEQAAFSLREAMTQSTAGSVGLLVALAGLALLVRRRRSETLFLAVPLALGGSSVVLGQRFAIFLAPVLALGAAYAVAATWRRSVAGPRWLGLPILAFLGYAVWAQFDLSTRTAASYPSQSVAGFEQIREQTPRDAVIWSWWDEGYPLVYWARRATVNDGQMHSGERTTYNAIPLASGDLRFAANFMQFYVARGVSGIQAFNAALGGDRSGALTRLKELLAAGPERARSLLLAAPPAATAGRETVEQWLEFFYPAAPRPLYLYIDRRHPGRTPWIVWIGSWEIARRDGEHPLPTYAVSGIGVAGQRVRHPSLDVDLAAGVAVSGGSKILLASAAVTDNSVTRTYTYEDPTGERRTELHGATLPEPFGPSGSYHLEVHGPTGQAIFQDRRIGDAVINRLYWRKPTPPSRYFRSVIADHPYYMLWEVRGDRVAPP